MPLIPVRRTRSLTRAGAAALLGTLLIAGVTGCTSGGGSPDGGSSTSAPDTGNGTSPAPTVTEGASGSALAAAGKLRVKGRAPKTGYDREARFGDAWLDTDQNGCGTRDDVLRAALKHAEVARDGCRVTSGTLADPYTGRTLAFVRGHSTVDIDHVVALSDAWQTGAGAWSFRKRAALANDPLNLLPVAASANRSKGDGDTASWLPPRKSFRPAYVARQVAVKRKYGLWVTAAEQRAMVRVLSAAPRTPLPSGGNPTEAPARFTGPDGGPSPSETDGDLSGGKRYRSGQFCPREAMGRTTHAADGATLHCRKSADGRARWR